MSELYLSGEYSRRHPEYHVADSRWKAAQITQMINRHRLMPSTVCEVGCGAGEVLRQLQLLLGTDARFTGYEISPHGYALCVARQNERLRFVCGDFLETEQPPCDLALCIDVFEHVEDYRGFLRRLRARATHHIFHVPLDLSAQSVLRVDPLIKAHASVGHLHFFTKDTALLALRDAGYEILDHAYTAGGLDLPKSWRARLLRLPRRVLVRIHPDFTSRLLGGFSLLVLAR